jgi:hypothetical protein
MQTLHISDTQLHRARRHLFDACDNLIIAGYETPDGRVRNIDNAKDELRAAAEVLGFDLVERVTPQDAIAFAGDTPNGSTMGFR